MWQAHTRPRSATASAMLSRLNALYSQMRGRNVLILLIILLLVFGVGGGGWGYRTYGPWGGGGIGIGTILVILLLVYLLGGIPVPDLHLR